MMKRYIINWTNCYLLFVTLAFCLSTSILIYIIDNLDNKVDLLQKEVTSITDQSLEVTPSAK